MGTRRRHPHLLARALRLATCAALASGGASALWLPDVFSDGMILQTYEQGDYHAFVYG